MDILLTYIDQIVLGLSLILMVVNTIRFVRQSATSLRKIPALLVVFGLTANATLMGAGHWLENSFHAADC